MKDLRIMVMILIWTVEYLHSSTVDCDFEEDYCSWTPLIKMQGQKGLVCGIRNKGYYAFKSCDYIVFYQGVRWKRVKDTSKQGGWVLQSAFMLNYIHPYGTHLSDLLSLEQPPSFVENCLRYQYAIEGEAVLVVAFPKHKRDLNNLILSAVHSKDSSYSGSGISSNKEGFVNLPVYTGYKIVIRVIYRRGYMGGKVTIDNIRVLQGRCIDLCSNNEFKCNDKRCISAGKVCDSIRHCEDGSDEENCEISGNPDIELQSCQLSSTIRLSRDCRAPRLRNSQLGRHCYEIVESQNSISAELTPEKNKNFKSSCILECPVSCSCVDLYFKCSTHLVPEVARVIDISGVKVPGNVFMADNFNFLVSLKLQHCGISTFKIRNTLTKLQSIDLSHNNIHEIDSTSLKNLIELNIGNNPINAAHFLQNLSHIRFLQMQNTSIRSGVLNLLNFGSYIDLSSNNFSGIIFSSVNYFVTLRCSDCILYNVNNINTSGMFYYTLNFQNNFFKEFKVTLEIVSLVLRNNSLEGFVELAVKQSFSHLRDIDLENNRISKLDKKRLQYFNYLEFINLRGNLIRAIDNDTFTDQSVLIYLDLSNNIIQQIHTRSFNGLVSLQYLYLQGNNIKQLNSYMFSELTELKTLDLSNNDIFNICEHSFFGLSILKNLSLQRNDFRVQRSLFDGLSALNFLYVDDYTLCCARPPTVRKGQCIAPVNDISSCDQLIDVPVLAACVWYIALTAVFGNALVLIYRFIKLRKTHSDTQSIFTINLSFADLLMGVYLYILAITNIHFNGEYGYADFDWRHGYLCTFSGILATLSSESSAIHVFLITMDRVIVIKSGIISKKISLTTSKILCLLAWAVSLVVAIVPAVETTYFKGFYAVSGVCISLPLSVTRRTGWEYSMTIFIGFNFILFLGILVCQILIFVEVVKSGRNIRTTQTRQREISLAKTLFAVVLTDMLCWIPIGIIGLMTFFGVDVPPQIYSWIVIVVLPLNSALNPLLYTFVLILRRKAQRTPQMKTPVPRSSPCPTENQGSVELRASNSC